MSGMDEPTLRILPAGMEPSPEVLLHPPSPPVLERIASYLKRIAYRLDADAQEINQMIARGESFRLPPDEPGASVSSVNTRRV